MKPPIFVFGEGYMDVFSTKERAESYVEAQFVDEYVACVYDSEGYLLDITVTPDNFVAISPVVPSVKKADDLRKRLQMFLKSVKKETIPVDWIDSASLNEIVAKALEHKTW